MFKHIKKSIGFLLIVSVSIFTLIYATVFLNNKPTLKETRVLAVSQKPKVKNTLRLVIGAVEKTDVAPLYCKGDSTFRLYGTIFNTTSRVVGLRAQDSKYVLSLGDKEYVIHPFKDVCINYNTKMNYLYPNASTKAYIEIVDKASSAGGVQFPDNLVPKNIFLTINTNIETDKKVKTRLESLITKPTPKEEESFAGSNYAFVTPLSKMDETAKQAAVGSLLALLLCPFAIIIADKVYLNKNKKKKS